MTQNGQNVKQILAQLSNMYTSFFTDLAAYDHLPATASRLDPYKRPWLDPGLVASLVIYGHIHDGLCSGQRGGNLPVGK